MNYEKMKLAFQGSVAVLTFNDPGVLNAVGARMREEFADALSRIEDPANGARCLLLTGAGRAFCSGANLAEGDRKNPRSRSDGGSSLETWYNPTFLRLRDLRMPFVSAVNGAAAGVGMSFALSADIVLAARSAYFLQAFARIGLVPDGGASYILPRRIGMARSMELSLLAERLPAEKALEWGLINQVHNDGSLMDAALTIAHRLASGPTTSLALMRSAYWQSLENTYEAQLDLERDNQRLAAATEDYREGVTAFMEKRSANFTGR